MKALNKVRKIQAQVVDIKKFVKRLERNLKKGN